MLNYQFFQKRKPLRNDKFNRLTIILRINHNFKNGYFFLLERRKKMQPLILSHGICQSKTEHYKFQFSICLFLEMVLEP